MSKRFGKNDRIFFLILLAVIGAVSFFVYVVNSEDGTTVEITVDGVHYGSYALFEDAEISIVDESGTETNTLLIADGTAKMVYADCPDKLCMHQNAISKSGENIVCLPNKVVCSVVGEEEDDGLDAIVK